MQRIALSILLVASTVLAGCFGGGEDLVDEVEMESFGNRTKWSIKFHMKMLECL